MKTFEMDNSTHAISFVLGQVPPQTVAVATGDHHLQLISLITGVAVQLFTLFLNRKRSKDRATPIPRTKKTPLVSS